MINISSGAGIDIRLKLSRARWKKMGLCTEAKVDQMFGHVESESCMAKHALKAI
jgi:hypothetical protein